MTKLKNPLLSLDARGRLAKLFAFAKRRGQNIIEQKPIVPDAKSPAQLFNRHMYSKCVTLWNLLSESEKQQWRSLARPKHMPGQAWFISQCLKPNPGIYLPLQGGTMKGDIDMDSFRLLNLIDPVLNQEPVTKKYFEDNVPPGAGDMLKADYDPNDDKVIALAQLDPDVCSEAEADGKILTHKGDASAHHTKYTDNEALAASVQAGAITDGVTKAPTHDAVFDVKTTANGAIQHSLATALSDFLVASSAGAFVKKTLTETLTILGKAVASGLASLDASSKVIQDPANATATPTASKIPIADGSGKLDGWVTTAAAIKVKAETRTMTAASGDVSYTGYGFTPTGLIIFATIGGRGSIGASDPAKASIEWEKYILGNVSYSGFNTNLITLYSATDVSQIAILKSYNADGFTLTWTKTGSPTGTANLTVFAFK